MVVVCVKLPHVPLIVTETGPEVGELPAVSVSVLVPVVELGLNDADAPLGRPEADKLTLPVNPFCGRTVIVVVLVVPSVRVTLFGEEERPKVGIVVEPGQLLTRLNALTVPMPVAKSHPVVVPYAG